MKRIIIADDDPGIQDVVSLILTKYGYRAEIHNDAERILNNDFEEPELFIIDRQLQQVDGIEVCRILKKRTSVCTPVIIFSAGNDLERLAKSAGADALLEKPFEISRLIQLIEQFTSTEEIIKP